MRALRLAAGAAPLLLIPTLLLAALAPSASAHGNEPVIPNARIEISLDAHGGLSAVYNLTVAASHDAGHVIRLPPEAHGVAIVDGSGRAHPFARDPDGAARLLTSGTPGEPTLWVTYAVGAPLPHPGLAIPLPHLGGAFIEVYATGEWGRLAPLVTLAGTELPPDGVRSGEGWQAWRWETDVLDDATLAIGAPRPDLATALTQLAPGVLLAALASLAAVGWAERRVPDGGARRMPVLSHLEEVRWRLAAVLISVIVGLFVFFGMGPHPVSLAGRTLPLPWPALAENYAARTLGAVAATTVPDDVRLIVTTPFEAVVAQLAMALLLTALVALPVALHQTYRFLRPGLFPREQRAFRRAIPLMLLLFAAGVAFGHLLLLPVLVSVLYAFADPLGVETLLSVGSFLSFVAVTLLTMGLAFELPAVMAGAVALGIATPRLYLKYWRHSIVAIFILAALVTDPTLVSQVIVGVVLAALYFAGVGLSMMVGGRKPETRGEHGRSRPNAGKRP